MLGRRLSDVKLLQSHNLSTRSQGSLVGLDVSQHGNFPPLEGEYSTLYAGGISCAFA
jgi:hypothetical protein